MDDNFKHRLKNWVDKREAQNRMRMKDITHVVDPGRIIPKEDKEVEDHNYYSKKIREYIQKRLEQQAVNKSEELDKGAKGDWQKEGYKLEYKQDDFENEPPRKSVTITAKDHNDNIVGEYKFSHHPNFKWVVPEDVYTHKDHVRKGLATAAYSLAEKITGKIADRSGGQSQTEDAKAFWAQHNRPFGKKEELDKVIISDDVSLNIKLPKHFNNMPDGIYDDGKTWMVHKKNGKIVGAIRFMEHNSKHNKNIIFQNDKIPSDDTSRIDYVWTHPDYRRQGIAKNLLLHAIKTHKAVESNLSASPSGNSLWQSLLGEKNINLKLSKNPDFGHIGWIKS